MPFGIGPLELLLLLALFCVPVGVVALVVRLVSRGRRSDSLPLQARNPQLAADLQATQLRLEELEAKLARSEERAAFTEALLEARPRQQ